MIFGMKKKVERFRATLVNALKAKSMEIMAPHANTPPDKMSAAWRDVARASVLLDLAEVIKNLHVEDHPDDDKE